MTRTEHVKSRPGERFVMTEYGFENIAQYCWVTEEHSKEVPKAWLDNGWVVSVKESAE